MGHTFVSLLQNFALKLALKEEQLLSIPPDFNSLTVTPLACDSSCESVFPEHNKTLGTPTDFALPNSDKTWTKRACHHMIRTFTFCA